ncbi:MAG: hypothetical protein Q6370_010815 [Candidatus Sigynarchaeota archaeon]
MIPASTSRISASLMYRHATPSVNSRKSLPSYRTVTPSIRCSSSRLSPASPAACMRGTSAAATALISSGSGGTATYTGTILLSPRGIRRYARDTTTRPDRTSCSSAALTSLQYQLSTRARSARLKPPFPATRMSCKMASASESISRGFRGGTAM